MIELIPSIQHLAAALILAVILAIASYGFKLVTASGAVGMMLIGTIVLGLGGWLSSIPILVFFISSSALTKLKSDIKSESMRILEKTGPRDIKQVLANGGVASLCILIMAVTGDQRWFYLYLASLAAATADTWATEIGTLSARKPISLITLEPVKPGTSGGVSIAGTLAALLGSITTVFSVIPFLGNTVDLRILFYAVCAGFIGSIIDSLLGATIQASYKCEACGQDVEMKFHCGRKTSPVRGLRFINNDMVNLISILIAGALLAGLIL